MKKLLNKKWYHVVLIILLLFFIGCTVSKLAAEKDKLGSEIPDEAPAAMPPKFETGPATYAVEIYGDGFTESELMVNRGDTVIWKNMREGKLKTALIQGTKNCVYLKGKLLQPDEKFEWTFMEEGKCQVMDAVTKVHFMDVIVK